MCEVFVKLYDLFVQILDVCVFVEYCGEDICVICGGYIFGVILINYVENWVDFEVVVCFDKKQVFNKDGMNLKSVDELCVFYLKFDLDKEIIVYCQSGVCVVEMVIVLQEIGFKKVKVYDFLWLGYGNMLVVLVEDVSFVNVGMLQGKFGVLQKWFDVMEKEMVVLKVVVKF